MRVDRDEQNVDVPQKAAAPIPPRIAATPAFSLLYAGTVAAPARGARQAIVDEAAACGDGDRDVRRDELARARLRQRSRGPGSPSVLRRRP